MNTPILILKPARDKKAYRLKCRFKIEPYPRLERLHREKVRVAEMFVADMHKQGWEYVERYGFTMKGPFPMVEPVTIHPIRIPTARDMLPRVANGARFLDQGESSVRDVPSLDFSEYWEFSLSGVFARTEILTEYPDPHEEIGAR